MKRLRPQSTIAMVYPYCSNRLLKEEYPATDWYSSMKIRVNLNKTVKRRSLDFDGEFLYEQNAYFFQSSSYRSVNRHNRAVNFCSSETVKSVVVKIRTSKLLLPASTAVNNSIPSQLSLLVAKISVYDFLKYSTIR